jgi:hypothetical protein
MMFIMKAVWPPCRVVFPSGRPLGGFVMETVAFGLTLTVVGMGGTLVTLGLLTLVVDLLKVVLPLPASDNGEDQP